MPRGDADFPELLPLTCGEGVAFYGEVVDIVGGQNFVDDHLVDALHGDEGVSKYLLYSPAVGIKFWVAASGDAAGPHMIYIQTVGNGLYATSM